MKILYVTHKPFYPIDGGDCIRMSQMLDELLRRGDVDVMYMAHSEPEKPLKAYRPAIGREMCVKVGRGRRLLGAVRTMFNRKPLLVNIYNRRVLRRRLLSVAPEYDAVVVGSLGTAHYCPALHETGIDAYLDLTDSATMNLDNEAALRKGLRRWWARLNARRMRRLETLWRDTARAVAFISEVDRDYLPVHGGRQVIVGNSVDLPGEEMVCRHAEGAELLFVGNMSYAPNVTAVTRFVDNVLPQVAEAVPQVKLHVVGSGVSEELRRRLQGNQHVVVEGFVKDLGACYREAGIFVAPMYSGSGIQNKILQALAAGCCVVTTPIGAEGLDTVSGAFVVAESEEEMAQAIVSLAGNEAARREYGKRARKYVAGAFSREVVARQVTEFLG